jgi:hypothetical protein
MQLSELVRLEQLATFAIQPVPSLLTKHPVIYPLQFDLVADPSTPVKPAVIAVKHVFSTQAFVTVFQRQVGIPLFVISQLSELNLPEQAAGRSMHPETVSPTGLAETHPGIAELQSVVVLVVLSIVVHPLSIQAEPLYPQSA